MPACAHWPIKLWGVLGVAGLLLAPLVASGQDEPANAKRSLGLKPVSQDVRDPVAHVHVPGRWSLMRLLISNRRDEPFEALSMTSVGEDTNLHFGRRVWVPPHARLVTWQPLLVPDELPPPQEGEGIQQIEFRSMLYDGYSSESPLVPDRFDNLSLREDLWVARPGPVTGIVEPPGTALDRVNPDVIISSDVIEAGRMLRNQEHNLAFLEDGLPPGGEESLDAYDQLVIAADTVLHDPASVDAVQRWLYGGGRLWVMLDRADDAILGAILGDEYTGQIVDRVTLTSVHIKPGVEGLPLEEQQQEYDKPVTLVRMLIKEAASYTVNGWPAAYWKPCGEGQLLVTTLGPAAWMRPLLGKEKEAKLKEGWRTDFYPGPALSQISSQFFEHRPTSILPPAVLETQAREYVGYTVPSRNMVVGLLGAFAVVLIGLGIWLLRAGEAQRLAVFGSLAAIVTSIVLMGVGESHHSLPSTTAVSQFVQLIPGTNDVRATGVAATYVAEPGDLSISGDKGGWLMPDMTGQGGTSRRLIWSGLDQWQWENLQQVKGLHASHILNGATSQERTSVRTSFDSSGLTGRLTLPEDMSATDALLATPSGRMGIKIAADGTFHANQSNLLREGEYLAADLLTDEQSRRSHTLASLLDPPSDGGFPFDVGFPVEPTLLFWTEPWKLGTTYPTDVPLTGSALVALPLTLHRPASGTQVLIPSPFLPYQEIFGPQRQPPPGVFDYRSGTWQERYTQSSTWLGIVLPQALSPMQLTKMSMKLDITGPAGRVEVATFQGEEVVPLKTWTDPQGSISFSWDEPASLQLDEQGRLSFQITLGDPDRPELTTDPDSGQVTYFRIESLSFEAEALVLDPDAFSTLTAN